MTTLEGPPPLLINLVWELLDCGAVAWGSAAIAWALEIKTGYIIITVVVVSLIICCCIIVCIIGGVVACVVGGAGGCAT